MSSFNKVSLFGNVGKDPEITTLQSGKKIAKFSLATSEKYTDKDGNKNEHTDWHSIIAWEKLAELCEKWVKKGSSIIIEGKISYRNYENKEGQKVYITEINAKEIYFTGKKEADSTITAKDEYQGGSANKEAIVNKSIENAGEESDLPF